MSWRLVRNITEAIPASRNRHGVHTTRSAKQFAKARKVYIVEGGYCGDTRYLDELQQQEALCPRISPEEPWT